MKTKEEAFEEYIKKNVSARPHDVFGFSAGWDAATANHDQELVEFAEYCAQLHVRLNYVWCHKYGDQTDKRNYIETSELLTKFRESNCG